MVKKIAGKLAKKVGRNKSKKIEEKSPKTKKIAKIGKNRQKLIRSRPKIAQNFLEVGLDHVKNRASASLRGCFQYPDFAKFPFLWLFSQK